MRVIEKSQLNDLILKGEENLKAERDKCSGQWIKAYKPEIFDRMIIELEILRKEMDGLTIEV